MKSLRRIMAVVVKEVRQLRRDRLTFGMIVMIPLIQLLLFGFAINTEVRHIPAAVRRAVHARDGGRCAFRDKVGRRCAKRHDLEFHHKKPFGRGGDHSPSNLTLMCRAHNTLMAEQDYGAMLNHFKLVADRYGVVNRLVSVPNHPKDDEEIVDDERRRRLGGRETQTYPVESSISNLQFAAPPQ